MRLFWQKTRNRHESNCLGFTPIPGRLMERKTSAPEADRSSLSNIRLCLLRQNFLVLGTVAFSFVFGNYCSFSFVFGNYCSIMN